VRVRERSKAFDEDASEADLLREVLFDSSVGYSDASGERESGRQLFLLLPLLDTMVVFSPPQSDWFFLGLCKALYHSPAPLRRKKKVKNKSKKKSKSMMVMRTRVALEQSTLLFFSLEQQQQQEDIIMRSSTTTSNLVAIVQVEKRFPYKPSR
jgi:hypothetical protein